jgi:O-antigen ligase
LPSESLRTEGSIFYFRYLFFALAVWYFLDHITNFSRCLLSTTLLCLIIVIIDGLYQYFVGVNIFGNEKWNSFRLTGLFGNEPIIGRYISFLSIFTFLLIYKNFQLNKKMMTLSIIFLVISEVTIFLTGERAPLFYISFFSILLLIFIPSFRIYRIVGTIFTLIIITIILSINPTAKERVIDNTIKEISETKLSVLPYTELHERHYVSALKMFQNKPVFGVGTNLFRHVCHKEEYQYKSNSCTSHPHNFYIQLLAELGIIGFSFLFIFYLFLLNKCLIQLYYIIIDKKDKLISFDNFLIFMTLLVFWWPIIPHMSFFNNWNNILLMLPVGFLLKYLYGKRIK